MWEIRLFEISGDTRLIEMNLTKIKAEKGAEKLNKNSNWTYYYQAFQSKSR